MAEESEDELEMLVEYDEEFSDSTTEDEGSQAGVSTKPA